MEKPRIIPSGIKAELLSDMEKLQVQGGSQNGDVHVYVIESCKSETYTYCHGANCVAGCSCNDPIVDPGKG